jgi:hypothetical protein
MGYDDATPEEIWAIEEFEGEITEDVEIVMLAMSHEFGYTLIHNAIVDGRRSEEEIPRWRAMRSDPGLKKRAEKIIVREIARMANRLPVNGPMRYCILQWCYLRDVGKRAGNPGLDFIEHMHRMSEVERIVGDGGSQKKIDRSIDERLGIRGKTGRTARAWKRRVGNKSK